MKLLWTTGQCSIPHCAHLDSSSKGRFISFVFQCLRSFGGIQRVLVWSGGLKTHLLVSKDKAHETN